MSAISELGNAIANAASAMSLGLKQVVRAHYNQVGAHTFPLEAEGEHDIPKPSELSYIGQGVSFIPIIITYALSLTVIPLIGNSMQSFKKGFVTVANLGLATGNEFVNPKEQRRWYRQLYGFPGLVLGGLVGFGALFPIGLGRLITNSWKTGERIFAPIVNTALGPDEQITFETEDSRHWFRRYVVGLPGLALGVAFGVIGAWVVSSVRTGLDAFVRTINWALPENRQYETYEDSRNGFNKFIIGSVGAVIGGFFGITFAWIISSVRTGAHVFCKMSNWALADDNQMPTPGEDNRNWFNKYVVGLPGFLIGGALGLASMFCIGVGRFFINNSKSFALSFSSFSDLALHKDNAINYEDTRGWFRKYVIGFPGLLLGAGIGFFAFFAIGLGRIVTNSWKTGAHVADKIINATLDLSEQTKDEADTRSFVRKYVVGSPGLLVGTFVGILGALVMNSAITAARIFAHMSNAALSEEDRISFSAKDDRPAVGKYGFGLLVGAPLGFVLGFVSMIVISFVRWASATLGSFSSLGGSLMNVAIERKEFDGLGGDQRPAAQKAVGVLGYLAAVAVVAPIAAAVYVVRKLPDLCAFALGIFTSPVTLLCKAISKGIKACQGNSKFANEASETENRFKNIYSSLNAWGKLNVGHQLPTNGSGEKSWGSFFRKCITFDIKSVSERTLDELLKASRTHAAGQASFFNNKDEFDGTVKQITTYYDDCLSSAKQIREAQQEVQDVADFVKDYMTKGAGSEAEMIPVDFYSRRQTSWADTFWGKTKDVRPTADAPTALPSETTPLLSTPTS